MNATAEILSSPELLVQKFIAENHQDYALVSSKSVHNHVVHALLNALKLNSDLVQLSTTHEEESKHLEVWPTPKYNIVSASELSASLGDKKQQHAIAKYFERELQGSNGNWKAIVLSRLTSGEVPLIDGLAGGYGHGFLWLADAFELDNPLVASEALAIAAVNWGPQHNVLSLPSTHDGTREFSVFEVVDKIGQDSRFDDIFAAPGIQNGLQLFGNASLRQAFLEYFQLFPSEPSATVEKELVELATLLLSGTRAPGPPAFDFYLAHQLSFAASVRSLTPYFEGEWRSRLQRSQWMLMLLAYLSQKRPYLDCALIDDIVIEKPADEEWDDVLNGLRKLAPSNDGGAVPLDPHSARAVRALKEFSAVYPEIGDFFLRAASRFVRNFTQWTGFGKPNEPELERRP
ncbi:hypothetical protein NA57DRAFT_75711 [Rhizodiscina lignyota]|uniref:Uncharacterized protein n=1 Tax=Rhizodiscina lignyota TaxID=1504668 RepID=A0A9P4IF19_9PEZI|nr:hypothetical protein NA57DRAFT_75711 [Rhizodiscina lignyota]